MSLPSNSSLQTSFHGAGGCSLAWGPKAGARMMAMTATPAAPHLRYPPMQHAPLWAMVECDEHDGNLQPCTQQGVTQRQPGCTRPWPAWAPAQVESRGKRRPAECTEVPVQALTVHRDLGEFDY